MAFSREQLLSRVRIIPQKGCWEFKGKRDVYGYGRIFSGNRELKAHRVFYEAWIEAVPEGLFVRHGLGDHACIGHACCFPFHLCLSPNSRRTDMLMAPSKTYAQRFEMFSQIQVIPQTGCWEFGGSVDRGGYGRLFVGGKERKTHDVFFEEWVGPVPPDQFLYPYIQNCIGRNCCNPTHWQPRSKIWKRLDPVPYLASHVPGETAPSVGAGLRLPNDGSFKLCPKGHLMMPANIVVENRKGHPKERCRTCRQESWRKNSARRANAGIHS